MTRATERVLQTWYRDRLRELVPQYLSKWAPVLEVEPAAWGIRRMKTKWGSCNPSPGRILLNLELAKKPTECIEYVVVHELAHLIERRHTDHFRRLLDRHLPKWAGARRLLNATPLASEAWER